MLPAAELLKVIEECATKAGDDVYHVPNRRDSDPEPEPWPISITDDDPLEDVTVVKASVLRTAIAATQAIRHARAADEDSTVTLPDEQIDALDGLSYHPALADMEGLVADRFWRNTLAADRAAVERAEQYLELLGEKELERRAAIDYSEMCRWAHGSGTQVDECPVCGNESLVVSGREGWLGEVAIGQCVVCSYKRTAEVADDIAADVDIQRKVEAPD